MFGIEPELTGVLAIVEAGNKSQAARTEIVGRRIACARVIRSVESSRSVAIMLVSVPPGPRTACQLAVPRASPISLSQSS